MTSREGPAQEGAGVQGGKGGKDQDYYEQCWEGKPVLTWEQYLALDQEEEAVDAA